MRYFDSKRGYYVNVGEIVGNIFHKKVIRSKHYFKLVGGYGIQDEAWQILKKNGIKKIVIKETDTGDILTSDLEDWQEHSGSGNWSHGKQRVLSDKYMEKRHA